MATQKTIPSDDIRIFPASHRDAKYDISSIIMTEENITTFPNVVVDKKSFFARSPTLSIYAQGNVPHLSISPCVFFLNGYRFELTEDIGCPLIKQAFPALGDDPTNGTHIFYAYFELNPNAIVTKQGPDGLPHTQMSGVLQPNNKKELDVKLGTDTESSYLGFYLDLSNTPISPMDREGKLPFAIIMYNGVTGEWQVSHFDGGLKYDVNIVDLNTGTGDLTHPTTDTIQEFLDGYELDAGNIVEGGS